MNLDPQTSAEQIDPLVRAALAADGREVDVARVSVEILGRLAAGNYAQAEPEFAAPRPARAPLRKRPAVRRAVRWGLALAACLIAAVGLGEWFTFSATPASAYSLVESAHNVLRKSRDRSYQVEIAFPKGWLTKSSFVHSDNLKFLCTRGDRFRFEMSRGDEELIWGQDKAQRTWFVMNGNQGLLFEPKELPQTVAATLSYLSVDFERLSLDILENFDLVTEDPEPGSNRDIVTVLATARPAAKSQHFHSARLEIDPKSKVVRKMELSRIVKKDEKAVMTFTLLNEDPQPDASYTLEGNLPPGATILGKDKARDRGRQFNKLLR
jgi:outer membrane lipoprotein-sorting protein